MAATYPLQDTFVRGEISPRLHARASLELYRAGLAKCLNFVTLPHGGLRRRGGTYYAGTCLSSSTKSRVVPFIFSSEQAYCLEFAHLKLRVYAYGARVGTVELDTPWTEDDLWDLQVHQSADQMWVAHPSYALRLITRNDHTDWSIEEYETDDGPYGEINTTATSLTPADRGSIVPIMTSNTLPSGTVAADTGSADAYKVFDGTTAIYSHGSSSSGWVSYTLAAGTKVCDAYWLMAAPNQADISAPIKWTFEGWNGSAWVVLDSRQGEDGWSRGERRFYEFLNETAYSAYRFNWDATNTEDDTQSRIAEMGWHEAGDSQTPFNLTASSIVGINDDTGFQATDVGRLIRLQGSDGEWRWARIVARTSTTVVTIRLYGQALPNLNPITRWHLGAMNGSEQASAVSVFEERLALAQDFSTFLSKTGDLNNFSLGEEDDAGMSFTNAGGGQANDIVWLADGDGYLLIATTGGVRALSGSGIDEALTPSSFKNRRSRTHGAARVQPVDAGSSFIYATRSRRSIAELVMNQYGRFTSSDIGVISEHIPKKGVVELAYQDDPDPVLWFPLDDGELAGYTHQPSEEVRGMHRHTAGGVNAEIESVAVTPGADGTHDDVWMVVKRTINGATARYIEVMTAPIEGASADLSDAINVDSSLTYEGAATNTLSGLTHLVGETVDVLASNKVYTGLVVSGAGVVTLPGGATTTKAQVGLPFTSAADTLELDVGGRDGSLVGRRKKVSAVILSLYQTDLSGLQIQSKLRGAWETARLPTNVASDGTISLYTGNVKVFIDDSWEGMGQISIRHTNPTPCTIRGATPIFDAEP